MLLYLVFVVQLEEFAHAEIIVHAIWVDLTKINTRFFLENLRWIRQHLKAHALTSTLGETNSSSPAQYC